MSSELIRPLTDQEFLIWRKARELKIGYKEGTNQTPLDYILTGRIKELEKLISQVEMEIAYGPNF